MPDPHPTDSNRRRWINLGEGVAVVGLIISGLALWNSWSKDDRPAVVVEHARIIPLALRGRVEDHGKRLAITPVESGHALETLSLTAPGKAAINLGSEPQLSASTVEGLLNNAKKDGTGVLRVTFAARYIEAGAERRGGGRYWLAYRWENGGLFGGRSLRLTALSRG